MPDMHLSYLNRLPLQTECVKYVKETIFLFLNQNHVISVLDLLLYTLL